MQSTKPRPSLPPPWLIGLAGVLAVLSLLLVLAS
jgi:hypothetical protein